MDYEALQKNNQLYFDSIHRFLEYARMLKFHTNMKSRILLRQWSMLMKQTI